MFDKEYFLRSYKDKTVAELRVILDQSVAARYSQDEEGARLLLAKAEACAELINKKNEAANYIEKEELNRTYSLSEWERANSARRKKAISNLPAATSYHGQLVVAVLGEEDFLTAEEIRQWSDELATMGAGEYHKLLKALCDEEILCCTEDGKYSILSFCTPDLMRTDPMQWLKQRHVCTDDRIKMLKEEAELKFWQHMIKKGEPCTEVDWIECTWINYRKNQVADNPQFHYGRAAHELSEFVKNGVLSITPIDDSDLHYYYFTMLGEKEGE